VGASNKKRSTISRRGELVGNNWLKWDHTYPKIGPSVISACDAALAVETGALVILLIDVVAAGRMPWDEAIQNQIVKDMTAVTAACIAVNAACDK
jgi:hypothetical protein